MLSVSDQGCAGNPLRRLFPTTMSTGLFNTNSDKTCVVVKLENTKTFHGLNRQLADCHLDCVGDDADAKSMKIN